jgi:hypothetical protein
MAARRRPHAANSKSVTPVTTSLLCTSGDVLVAGYYGNEVSLGEGAASIQDCLRPSWESVSFVPPDAKDNSGTARTTDSHLVGCVEFRNQCCRVSCRGRFSVIVTATPPGGIRWVE